MVMKTFIIAAITADGFIGQDNTHLSTKWSTKADKKFFMRRTKQAGVALFGRTTYETFKRALPERRTIVYTSRPESVAAEGVETISGTPTEVIAKLQQQGVRELAICGGAKVYAEFLGANLVDELYITVHPIVFGAGIPLFRVPLQRSLKLLDMQNIGDDTVLLHYKLQTAEAA